MLQNNIARLNTDGTRDPSFSLAANGTIFAIAMQPDGKILVGGFFSIIGGQVRNGIARLDGTTGLVDPFDPNVNSGVLSIVGQADGRILVVGDFTSFSPNGGTAVVRNHIARLNADGTLDMVFDPNANGDVYSIALRSDGILTGGTFFGANSIGGQTRNFIARLDSTTGLADSFDPNSSNLVTPIAVQADGKILTGGAFLNIGGQARHGFARLDAASGVADTFDPNPTNMPGEGTFIGTIAPQSDGKIWAAGQFANIGGQVRHYIARLDQTTGFADSFDANVGVLFHAGVGSIAVQTDGKILPVGSFTSVGGQSRTGFARLTNDTAALQDLNVTQNSIAWTRGGSSPLLTRVTFEYSTDNVNYSLFGNGVAAGSDWMLSGLNFPVGQNIYVRARGYYPSGVYNGSQSITETVRNSFFFGPTRVVSRNIHGSAGAFDIDLPMTGSPGVECRSGGANGDYQIVFTFLSEVTFDKAVISGGAGTISGTSGSGTG